MMKPLFISVAALLALTGPVPAETPVLDVGARKQLFVDHRFIESADGVALIANPPQRTGEILVTTDAPWEKGLLVASYSSIAKENGRVRLWYQVSEAHHEPGKNPDFMGVAYAEPTDGIRFEKPILGLVEHNGSKRNNFVMPHDPKLLSQGGCSVTRDDNPACPPGERYKSWQKIYPKPGSGIRGPHRVWVSPDGLRWQLSPKPVTGLRAADTQPTWFWNPRTGRYAGYSREWVRFPEGPVRMASYNESDDMHAWEKMQMALGPDEADFAAFPRPAVELDRVKMERDRLVVAAPGRPAEEELRPGEDPVPFPGAPVDVYGPGVFPYLEADGVYVATAAMFHHWRRDGRFSWPDTGDVRLATSRDGIHFQQTGGRQPFLRPGPAGAFDSKWLWPMPRPVRMGDELWVYYVGTNEAHSGRVESGVRQKLSAISRAVMRLDGFVSADFDHAGGSLVTPPLRFAGSRLELNLDTAGGGFGFVELLDERGVPIPGYTLGAADPLNGNSVRMRATWQGKADVSALAGKPVRLRLRMRAAKLYAFQFVP